MVHAYIVTIHVVTIHLKRFPDTIVDSKLPCRLVVVESFQDFRIIPQLPTISLQHSSLVTRRVVPLSPRRPLPLDHIGALLADHDHRRVDVPAGDGRHDGRVDHSQPVHTVHLQLRVHDGHGVAGRAHLRRAAHVINRHGVLSYGTVPVLVREQCQMAAVRQRAAVKPGAEPLQAARLAERDRCFHAFPQHVDVLSTGQVIVIHEGIVERVAGPELDEATGLGPEQHREDAEHVAVVDGLEHLVVELVGEAVGVLHVGAAVGRGGRGREHELDVRPVVALVRVLRRDEADRLEADVRRQRPVLRDRVPKRRVQVHQPGHHRADRVVDQEDQTADRYVILQVLPDTRRVVDHRDPHLLQVLPGPDTRQHQQLRGVYGTWRDSDDSDSCLVCR